MSFFQHLSENSVVVSNGSVSLTLPLVTFLQFEPLYVLPTFIPALIGQYYQPGVKHTYTNVLEETFDAVFPWTDGDYYISKTTQYIDQYATLNASYTLQTAINIRNLAVLSYSRSIKLGGINFKSTVFPSVNLDANEVLSFENQATVPTGFYVLDIYGNEVAFTLNDLQDLNNYISTLHLLCNVNAHNLSIAIDALTTIQDVENFDISTGWPTTPYTPS
jgi:hypothetical protein